MSDIKATPKETVEALLNRSKRPKRAVPIRNTFIQDKDNQWQSTGPGPLAAFVSGGDATALDLILLLRAVASSDNEEDGYSVRQAAGVWRRALAHCGHQISIPAVSKAWTRLEKRKQIAKTRSRRLASVTVLREDGLGAPYTHPFEFPCSHFGSCLVGCGSKQQSNHESERGDGADESPVEMEGLGDHGLGEHGKYSSGGQGGDGGEE